MKYLLLLCIGISMLYSVLSAQDCSITSRANDITPDHLCSPVSVNWNVSYRGVNDAGTLVQIKYDWDDGSVDIYDAVNIDPTPGVNEWGYMASHIYPSTGNICNYHPTGTLIVDGQVCTSSTQEQIVTVWDTDDKNGGELMINPEVYPICVGNGADVRFQDVTLFNCVPPQENDVPNLSTRWIQWIYGTSITMTGAPVTINGSPQAFPYYGSIITLPGPVSGSGIFSDIMNVANDKLIGQHFEVTLRYWNYCNPWDDPMIPGPPADPLNGDHAPIITTAIILIVPYPDAKIDPVDPICVSDDNIFLAAADGGGNWSGDGIINSHTAEFDPSAAGPGDHIIRYDITDGNGCSDWDTVIVSVTGTTDATITPEGPFCDYSSALKLKTAAAAGTWSGNGITDSTAGIFNPVTAGAGNHMITFISTPDANGCFGADSLEITVTPPPVAHFTTTDSSWCSEGNDEAYANISIDGSEDLDYDLVWEVNGTTETIPHIGNDSLSILLSNKPGLNTYKLLKITENFTNGSCFSSLDEKLELKMLPSPPMKILLAPDGGCSPVTVGINTTDGKDYNYTWNFGDGATYNGDSAFVGHTYFNLGKTDTIFKVKLIITSPNGCSDSISSDLPVYPSPRADFFVSPAVQDYPASDVMISNFSSPGNWKYDWNFGDGNTSVVKQPGGHNYKNYGEFMIRLRTFSDHCSDTLARTIRILPPPPQAAFKPDTSGCSPLMVNFNNKSLYGETYLWDFDDGTFSVDKEPVHTFYSSRDYEVKLLVSGIRGKSEARQTIRVYPFPRADFSAFPDSASRTDQVFKFINKSERAVEFEWEFGDGSLSYEKDPVYVYNKEGRFDVSLCVWSQFGCPDTIVREKYVKIFAGEGQILFPNVFKWNGSGPTGGYWTPGQIDNTVFHPYFENVEEYELIIYDRWGELVYTSDDLYKGWDGYMINGGRATQGVYVYKAWVTYTDGLHEIKVGDVTFLH